MSPATEHPTIVLTRAQALELARLIGAGSRGLDELHRHRDLILALNPLRHAPEALTTSTSLSAALDASYWEGVVAADHAAVDLRERAREAGRRERRARPFVPRVHDLRFGFYVRDDGAWYTVVARDDGRALAQHDDEIDAARDALVRDGAAKTALLARLARDGEDDR